MKNRGIGNRRATGVGGQRPDFAAKAAKQGEFQGKTVVKWEKTSFFRNLLGNKVHFMLFGDKHDTSLYREQCARALNDQFGDIFHGDQEGLRKLLEESISDNPIVAGKVKYLEDVEFDSDLIAQLKKAVGDKIQLKNNAFLGRQLQQLGPNDPKATMRRLAIKELAAQSIARDTLLSGVDVDRRLDNIGFVDRSLKSLNPVNKELLLKSSAFQRLASEARKPLTKADFEGIQQQIIQEVAETERKDIQAQENISKKDLESSDD